MSLDTARVREEHVPHEKYPLLCAECWALAGHHPHADLTEVGWPCAWVAAADEAEGLRARLAKAERERDEWHACARRNFDRLAAVEALAAGRLERGLDNPDVDEFAELVLATARKEEK